MEISQHQIYGEILDQQDSMMCILAPDKGILHVNRSWAGAIDQTPEQVIGKSLLSFLTAGQQDTALNCLRAAAAGETVACTLTMNRYSRSALRAEWNIKAALDERGILQYYVMIGRRSRRKEHLQAIDRVETEGSLITARQQAEQAAGMKDEFLATLSYEIQTPLKGMLGLIEMLNETDTDARQQKLLKNLLSSCKLLLRVVDEIYELDDIRTDTASLQDSKTRFNHLKDDAGARKFKEEDLKLILLGSPDASLIVLSRQLDSEAVNHRLCKAADDARQALEKSIAESGHKAEDCQLLVDLNIGQEAALSFINEIKNRPEFINLHISLLHAAGQSISKDWKDAYDLDRIVQKPVSTVQLRQMLGKAPLTLHQSASEADEKTEPADSMAATSQTGEKSFPDLRVLVAEDNKVNRMLIKFILDRLHLRELKIVEDGLQALEAVKASENAFDLILMDCQMPVMSGFEASRRIRALPDAAKSGSHITAVTAFATSTYSKHSIEAGMDDYITKPYTIARIQELMSTVSARKKNAKPAQKASETAPSAGKPEDQADLNMEKLRRRFDNNEVLVREMLEMFLNDSTWQLEQLSRHAGAQDWKALYELNHQVKGAAATMSADYLFRQTSALQNYLEQDPAEYDISQINKFIQEFENSFSRIRQLSPDKKKPSQ
jgi:CheY-like chemotaxis protein